mgnify:CR=1 FL=1|jgi:hypothetical protein
MTTAVTPGSYRTKLAGILFSHGFSVSAKSAADETFWVGMQIESGDSMGTGKASANHKRLGKLLGPFSRVCQPLSYQVCDGERGFWG